MNSVLDAITGKAATWLGSVHGALFTTSPPLTLIEYSDATYKYLCEAKPESARSDTVWQVLRITLATNDATFAGTGKFEHAATNIATVTALTYTLGA